MKTISMTLQGISSLLMHAFPMVPIEGMEKKPPEEQAELALYRQPDGTVFFPGMNLQRSLVKAGAFSKGKGRASLAKMVAASVFISPEALVMNPQKWEVDGRPVVIAATRGRVMRYRPRFDKWELKCEVEYDETLLTEAQLRRVVDDAGSKTGLGDFRPERNGSFGRFMVTNWKKQ